MTETTLQEKIRQHNTRNLALGLLMIPASVVAWIVSFRILRTLFGMFLHGLSFLWPGLNTATASHYLAMGCLMLLAVEGFRRSRDLFDLADFSQSRYRDSVFMSTSSGQAMGYAFGNPAAIAYVISQILFLAPEATRQTARLLIGRLPQDDAMVKAAAAILNELADNRQWIPRGKYHAHAASLAILQQLKADLDAGRERLGADSAFRREKPSSPLKK